MHTDKMMLWICWGLIGFIVIAYVQLTLDYPHWTKIPVWIIIGYLIIHYSWITKGIKIWK